MTYGETTSVELEHPVIPETPSCLRALVVKHKEMPQLRLEPDKQHTHACPCCGHLSRTVWGCIYENELAVAAYDVRWTMEHVREHGAHFDLMIGRYGEHSAPSDRVMVTLLYRPGSQGGFTVVDAAITSDGERELVASALRREQVIGTELAQRCFDMVDVIWLEDARLTELVTISRQIAEE